MAPGLRPLIQLRDAWKVYHLGDVEVRALRGISLDIRASEFLAIVGASGSGKSTCMNLIGCLDQPTRGTYRLGDADVATLSANAPSVLLADEPTGNLDSQSSIEIMELFVRLRWQRRVTIVVVTHEPHIADYTERVVTFRDGRIVSDLPQVSSRHAPEAARG